MFVVVRKGDIAYQDGNEMQCHIWAHEHLPDDKFVIMPYETFVYYKTHPSEVPRKGLFEGLLGNISKNIKSGEQQRFMQRPQQYFRTRRRYR